jgi:hypothetical protein
MVKINPTLVRLFHVPVLDTLHIAQKAHVGQPPRALCACSFAWAQWLMPTFSSSHRSHAS